MTVPDPDLEAAVERRDIDAVVRLLADRLSLPGDVENLEPPIAERTTRNA